MYKRKRMVAIAVLVAIAAVASLALGLSLLYSQGETPNDPTAARLYFHSLQRAIDQARLTVHVVRVSRIEENTGGVGLFTVTDRLRYVRPDRVEVLDQRVGWLPYVPTYFTLVHGHFCVGYPNDSGCAPAHSVSIAWYIEQFLLGGTVANLHFQRVSPAFAGQHTIGIRLWGKGALGCTPAGAGAGTRSGYRWCQFSSLDPQQRTRSVTGEMVLDARTGLPLRLTAQGQDRLGPVTETATFTYGGNFTVRLPAHARQLPCLSFVPAIHCVELHHATRSSAPPWLQAMAHSSAIANGDPRPSKLSYDIRGDRAVVTMHGHFVCESCTRPYRAPAPRGTINVMIVDMHSHTIETFGLSGGA